MAGVGGLTQDQIREFLMEQMDLDPAQNYQMNELSQRYYHSGLWLGILASAAFAGGLDVSIYDEAYGAQGDGVTSDTAAVQAAIDHVYAAGGGVVNIARQGDSLILIDGPIVVKEGVSLRGDNNSLVGLGKSTFKFSGATARITIGSGSARGGASGHFNIDCDGQGNPAGALVLTIVQQTFHDVTVEAPAGVGVLVLASQNSFVYSVDVNAPGTHNFVIDGGSGGMIFTRCELTTPGAGSWAVKSTESAPGGHPTYGYQYGPAHNEWHHCIFEHYGANSPAGLILIEAGTRQVFRSCGISNSFDDTFTSGYQVKITNDCFPTTVQTVVEFNGCNFHGGGTKKYPVFYVQGTNAITKNVLVVTGQTQYQFTTCVYTTDGVTIGHLDAQETYVSVDALFNAIGAGSWFFWKRDSYTGIHLKMPVAAGAWAGAYPIQIGLDTDAGVRFIVSSYGELNWCSGANFTPLAQLTYNSTLGAIHSTKGNSFDGKRIEGRTTLVIPSAGYALSLDASVGGPEYWFTISGATSIATAVIINPTDKQVIDVAYYRVGAQAVVYPTASYSGGAAPAAPTAGTVTWVKFKYHSTTGKWYEQSRSVNVPV